MNRHSFFISEQLMTALRLKAQKTGTPVSEHLRAALAEYLDLNGKPKP